MSDGTAVPPGWYPDGGGRLRWWDGWQWTSHAADPPSGQPLMVGHEPPPGAALRIPSAPLAAGVPLPALCIPHGRPAVATRRARFDSGTSIWLYVAVGLLASAMGEHVDARAIPVCDSCLATQRSRRLVVAIPITLAFLAFVAAGTLGSSDSGAVWTVVVLSLVALAVAVGFAKWTRWAVITGGRVTQDGRYVEFREVSPAFARAFDALARQPS